MPFGNFLNRRGSNMSQAPMPRPTNPVMAPQMPVQGPMPYGMPDRNPFQEFASNQSAAGNPIQTSTMGPNGMVQQQPLSQNMQQLYKAFLNASRGSLPTGPQPMLIPQGPQPVPPGYNMGPLGENRGPDIPKPFMPFPAGDPRYVNALPAMYPGMAPTTTQNQGGFGPMAGGIGQLYGQLGVNNGAQLFGQPSSAPGMAPNSAPGAAPTSGPVATPTGPASVNMF